jgi:predicted HAD superfamily phosphohydrolase YqeG
MEIMDSDEATTFYVGDQLFTDIWGANRAGFMSYLVKQIDKKEELQIVIKRFLEKPVLYFYWKKEGAKNEN